MSAPGWANALLLAAALAASLLAGARWSGAAPQVPAHPASTTVSDAWGRVLPARAYLRIASVSSLADQLLVELVEPERLVAVSADTAGPTAFRLGARPRLVGPDDLERLLALHPDLLVASSFGNPDLRLERVRAAGIAVLDLGESRGLRTLPDTIRRLAAAIDAAPRGERMVDALGARVRALTPPGDVPRPRALYIATIADRLFGGTVGTAYHDILATAGLDDAAAGRFRDWPQYAVEDVLALDPDLIVTATGGADALRRLPGIAGLRACVAPGGIVEVDPGLLDDPGLLIPDAAAALRRAVERDAVAP